MFIEAASYPSSNSVLLLHATFPGVSSKGTKPLLSRGKGFCYRPASLVLSLACPSHSTGINPKSFCLFFHLLCSERKGYSAWLATQLSNHQNQFHTYYPEVLRSHIRFPQSWHQSPVYCQNSGPIRRKTVFLLQWLLDWPELSSIY